MVLPQNKIKKGVCMKCPFCSHNDSKVVDKRDANGLDIIRRRRECLGCAKRFTTYERIEVADLRIIKKDGRRELFDRGKLMNGVLKACEKRPVSRDKIEELVNSVEAELRNKESTEIPSREIGEIVMDKLKELDKVAYIRFASVYRDFTDIKSFEKELKLLKKDR